MERNENYIDQLFESARIEAPKLSFDKTKATFLVSVVALPSVMLAAKPFLKWMTTKFWIATGGLSVVTVGTVIAVSSNPTESTAEPINQHSSFVQVDDSLVTEEIAPDTIEFLPIESVDTPQFQSKTIYLVEQVPIKRIAPQNLPVSGMISIPEPFIVDISPQLALIPQKELPAHVERVFTISPSTSNTVLDSIKTLANAANVDFYIEREEKKGELQKFEIYLSEKGEESHHDMSIVYELPEDSILSVNIGWIEDSEGNFISFIPFNCGSQLHNDIMRVDLDQGLFMEDHFDGEDESAEHTEKFEFHIHERTSKEELEDIRKMAAADGITIDFTTKYRGGVLKNIQVSMKYGEPNGPNYHHANFIAELKSKDHIHIEWIKDSEGSFISFEIKNHSDRCSE